MHIASTQIPTSELSVISTGRALDGVHVPPTKVFRRLTVNKTILKPCLAAAMGTPYLYMEFSQRNKIPEKAIQLRHPDYNLDWAQKLISSSMSRHLSTRNISSKSMHTFLSNLANRQTDKRRRAKTFTFSFVRGNSFKN